MITPDNIKKKITQALQGGEILFIVPPFASSYSPVIGPHILQALAEQQGFKTQILYLNNLLSSLIGLKYSESLSVQRSYQTWQMLPERLFARSAYNLPPLGQSPEQIDNQILSIYGKNEGAVLDYEKISQADQFNLQALQELEKICFAFIDQAAAAIIKANYPIIGCTVRMGQTNSAVALLNRLKAHCPAAVTLIGGSNCREQLAKGIASLSPNIDYVFGGESEIIFSEFLDSYQKNKLPCQRVIEEKIFIDLDSAPPVNYDDYFNQLELFLGKQVQSFQTGIWYEISRGCWWAREKKCPFCGLSDQAAQYRQKSKEKVLTELKILGQKYEQAEVVASDSIMPLSFQKEILPHIKNDPQYPPIAYYYTKSNLKLNDLLDFQKARIHSICPGIEALSTGILKLINKGVTAVDNLNLLRGGRSVGLNIIWFLLWGIPGDSLCFYEETLKILPLIRHFQPPLKFSHIFLERFSRYYETPGSYNITHIRPWHVYSKIYPAWADLENLAYYFTGDYPCASSNNRAVIKEITREVTVWKNNWKNSRLTIAGLKDYYLIVDSRSNGKIKKHVINQRLAHCIMCCRSYTASEEQEWALQEKLALIVDNTFVPLVTAAPALARLFEENKLVCSTAKKLK